MERNPVVDTDYESAYVDYEYARANAEKMRAQHMAVLANRALAASTRGLLWIGAALRRSAGRMLNVFQSAAEKRGRELVRQELLYRSDRVLEDMGYVPELVRAGVHAWPWTASDTAREEAKVAANRIRLAVRELHSCTDRELSDLGITRGDIERVVVHGRQHTDPLPDGDGGNLGKVA